MADGYFPTLISKDKDPNLVTNPVFVELSDGTSAVTVTGGNLGVLVNNAAGASAVNIQDGGNSITIDGAVTVTSGTITVSNPGLTDAELRATPVPVSGTVAATQSGTWDIGTVTTITNPVAVTDNGGSLTVDAVNLDIRDLTFATDKVDASGSTLGANSGVDIGDVTINNAAGASAVNIQDGGNSITVDGAVTVSATDLDIRNLTLAQDAVQISANSSVNSAANPIFVQSAVAAITGAVCDYSTATVAGNSTSNHDYTVTTSMLLSEVSFSCSGGGKVELQVGPVATLVSKWVGFIPKQGGTVTIEFPVPILVPVTSTGTVRLIRTNRESQSQDVYSTIVGIDA